MGAGTLLLDEPVKDSCSECIDLGALVVILTFQLV